MSHGHLSKVERGEHGRPVTPAILAAYEKVTGVSLADAAAAVAQREGLVGRGGVTWRPGQLTDMRRLAFNAAVGALAVGGQLGEPFARLVDSTGRPVVPAPLQVADAAQLEQLGEFLTVLDLRFGGGLASQLAKVVLRWAVVMLDAASVAEPAGRRLYGAVGAITARAAWAGFDDGAHESARSLLRLAIYAAVRSGDADLRAHLLADAAAQHSYLGYHGDALALLRLADGDERVATPVRMVLHGVRARASAALGQVEACRRQVGLAERAYADSQPPGPGWLGRLVRPGHLYAATGHAVARLARDTEAPGDVREACRRLGQAVEAFDPDTHTRALALCLCRLAALHLGIGELEQGAHWARQALAAASLIRSVRLERALAVLRSAAVEHSGEPVMRELVADFDTASGAGEGVTGDGTL
jgi:hypothetical protein